MTLLLDQGQVGVKSTLKGRSASRLSPSLHCGQYTFISIMSTSNDANGVDPALHTLAISISRELNLVNPNDLLAQRVLDLARANADSLPAFSKAVKTFGRFRDAFLQEVWMDSKASKFTGAGAKDMEAPHGQDDGGDGEPKQMIGNLIVEDSEVMMPPKQQPGGLMRPGLAKGADGDKHVFKAPTLSTNGGTSSLGLDKLAAEKRRERLAEAGSERDSKRKRYDDRDEYSNGGRAEFKGAYRVRLRTLL